MANTNNSEDDSLDEQTRPANYGKYRELKLKPSDDFINDLGKDENSPQSSNGKTNISLSMQQIERNSNVYYGASKGVVAGAPKVEQAVKYKPTNRKLVDRASSLKFYAITALVLGLIGLFNTFLLLSLYHFSGFSGRLRTEYLLANSAGIGLYLYPVFSSLLLLATKSLSLTKAILIINIVDAFLVAIQSLLSVLFVHIGGSFTYIPSIIIELALGAWAWSVLAEVKSLMKVTG